MVYFFIFIGYKTINRYFITTKWPLIIFDGNKSLIGKTVKVKIENSNQNSLFGKIEKSNDMRAA